MVCLAYLVFWLAYLPRSLFKKVSRLEKSKPPPVVAVVTNMRYGNNAKALELSTDYDQNMYMVHFHNMFDIFLLFLFNLYLHSNIVLLVRNSVVFVS